MPPLDIDELLGLPRISGLVLSRDGTRLVTTVATVAPDGKQFSTALWELDPAGHAQPRRLTRSAKGEVAAAFLPDGGLLFRSRRPDPDAKPDPEDDEEERSGLWLLPAQGGEARLVAHPPGGVDALSVAQDAAVVAMAIAIFPGAESPEQDSERFKARKDAGVAAQLFEGYPIRYWDHYLGPRERRIFVATVPEEPDDARLDLRQVAEGDGHRLDEVSFALSPDGSLLFTGWRPPGIDPQVDLVEVDIATANRRILSSGDVEHTQPACSPDGRSVVCVRTALGTPEEAPRATLWLTDLATGESRDLTPDIDLWPRGPVWAPDGSCVYFVADEAGRAPVFRVDAGSGTAERLAANGAYSDLCGSPDGGTVYALRAAVWSPPEAVAIDVRTPGQPPRAIPTPGLPIEVPGRVEDVVATTPDGTAVRSWLVLPGDASASSPAPLLLWVHGGPLASWNTWSWRWNPWAMVSRGYAVLLPDPALSLGYGRAFIQRGWARWGSEPYTDLMAAVDAAVARPDIDAEATAALGGSFGGYMVNWIAGHTDRFRAIVTHASLWALDQFYGTTDEGTWWRYEFGDPYLPAPAYAENSPNLHVGRITTPMLVIHGELDARVPVSEALRLWMDMRSHGVPSKFLYFPDENHWVLKPQNARVWYATVLAWLDHYLLGKDWERPGLL